MIENLNELGQRSNVMGSECFTVTSQSNVVCVGDSHILTPASEVTFDDALERCNDTIKASTFAKNGATVSEITEFLAQNKNQLQVRLAGSQPTVILSAGINDLFRAQDVETFSDRYLGLIAQTQAVFGREAQIVCLATQAWAHAYSSQGEDELHMYRESTHPSAREQMLGKGNDEKRAVLIANTQRMNELVNTICEESENLSFCVDSYAITADKAPHNILVDGEHFNGDVVSQVAQETAKFLAEKNLIPTRAIVNQR